jgi:hypothetical protein
MMVCAFIAQPAAAQRTTATFAGIVQDQTGAVLPGAEAELVNEGTSAVQQRVTNETGEFVFDFVPVGTYTFKLALPGFKGYESQGIQLGAAQTVRRTYTLEVGAVTDSVTVTGEMALVNTVSPEQRLNLDTLEIASLPMVNRNITNLIEYSGSGLTKGEAIAAGSGGVRFRLNGLGGAGMSATANGTDANGNGSSVMLGGYGGFTKIDLMSAEAVGEVQVVKGVIPAEFTGLGGNISVITKSGTNAWHGSLFHRYEGSVFSARRPALAVEQNSVWNQFGGSIGGPIVRDKAFFFFAYEGYRQRTTIPVISNVPTQLLRDTFRQSLPFRETDIVLSYYPLPTDAHAADALTARWVGAGISQNDDDHFDWKIDYLVGGGNFSLTFSGGHPHQIQGISLALNPRTTTGRPIRANASYVIGKGSWTSSTRVGFNQNLGQRVEKFWYEKDPSVPETVEGWRGVPSITYPSMTTLSRGNRYWGVIPNWSFEQQIALLRGVHAFKFGGVFSSPGSGNPDLMNSNVSFQNITDVRNNTPSGVNMYSGIGPNSWRLKNFGFYAQDDWRVNRKLVLNLGLRYDRYGAFSAKPRFENQPHGTPNFDGLLDSVNFIWGPLRPVDKPVEPDNMNLAPRFGFAYTADNDGDFVVRGGFGVNFSGIDPGHLEARTTRGLQVPQDIAFSRAEATALGLRFPAYTENMIDSFLSLNRPTQPSARFEPHFQSPYAMNYTLGIQKALTSTLVLETAFVGTRGVKFFLTRTFNQVDRVTGIRPNPNDIQGLYVDNSQQTNYNSWQTTLKQRLTRGLQLSIDHTWGKALSYVGGDIAPGYMGDSRNNGIEDFNNIKIERSLSAADAAHTVTMDWVYQAPTPFASSALSRQILGGWQIAGIWKGRTGTPLGVSQTGGRPDIIDFENAVNKNCCSYGNRQYLNAAAFQLVSVPSSGRTIRRGYANATPFRGPGFWNLDLSMGKSFSVRENTTLQLKGDMLNVLNHTNYSGIATNLSGNNFGEATPADSSRAIQIQLRLAF